MIKYQKLHLKTKQDLLKLPNRFVGVITELHLGKTTIAFKTKREDVTTSRQLKKVLRKLDISGKNLLLLTNNLTKEAKEILKAAEIVYKTIQNFEWTDESYTNIRE
ncbi:MAG: hypothetical protein ACPG5B_05150 [Chitinophagales bacterium]